MADYLTMVTGGAGALGGQTITPQFRQPALGALSGGLAGAQLGQTLGYSGASGIAPFAIGGGLLGMMG